MRDGKNLFELIEDEQWHHSLAVGVLQDIVAVMQKFPQRFAFYCRTGFGPLTGSGGGRENCLLDLLGGRRRIGGVIDPNVDRAIALWAQSRHDARAQDRGLAKTGLTEQHGQEFALYASRQFADLLFTAIEKAARFFGEGGEA